MKSNQGLIISALLLQSLNFLECRTIQARQTSVITNCVVPGTMALTFDDGPYVNENTLSDYLVQRNAKGTFFVNGFNYRCIYEEDIVRQLKKTYEQGHLIASHSWSHPNITLLSDTAFRRQLDLTETALEKIIGVKPKYFRPPYGSFNQQKLNILRERGYTVVNWSFDSGDSTGVSPQDSISSYTQLAQSYPAPQLALNHETTATTVNSVIPAVVPVLQQAGYRLVHVSECLGLGTRPQDLYQSVKAPSTRDSSWTCNGTPAPGSG